jgi:hypothetical protein
MMPQLGVLTAVHPKAATEVFTKDCLIHLGTVLAPAGEAKEGKPMMRYKLRLPSGESREGELPGGKLELIPLGVDETAEAVLEPERGFDVGAGKGNRLETTIHGGVVGIVLDGRGRPLALPEDQELRVKKLKEWMLGLGVYSESVLERM